MHFKMIRHDVITVEHHKIVIDTSNLGPYIETMAMTPSGREFTSRRFRTDEELYALQYHKELLEDFVHHDALLKYVRITARYEQMVEHLRTVYTAAEYASIDLPDDGVRNVDRCYFTLTRGNDISVRAAAIRAGVQVSVVRYRGGKIYIIEPPLRSLASRNTAQAKTMVEQLRALGYSADIWHQAI